MDCLRITDPRFRGRRGPSWPKIAGMLDKRLYLATAGTGLVLAFGWTRMPKIEQSRCGDLGLGCAGLDLIVVPGALFLAALLTWGILAAAGVGRPWLVALLMPFPVFTLVLTVLDETTELASTPVKLLFLVAVVFGYVFAALLSDGRVAVKRRVAAAVLVAVVLGGELLARHSG